MRLICFILLCPLYAMAWTVFIDPGHGGSDRGAVYNGIREAELTLSVSQKLKALLSKDSRMNVRLSRQTDLNLALPERITLAENSKADVIISVHANAAEDSR